MAHTIYDSQTYSSFDSVPTLLTADLFEEFMLQEGIAPLGAYSHPGVDHADIRVYHGANIGVMYSCRTGPCRRRKWLGMCTTIDVRVDSNATRENGLDRALEQFCRERGLRHPRISPQVNAPAPEGQSSSGICQLQGSS